NADPLELLFSGLEVSFELVALDSGAVDLVIIPAVPFEGQLSANDRLFGDVVRVSSREADEAPFQRAGPGAIHLQPPGAVPRFVDHSDGPPAVELFVAGEGGSYQKQQRYEECTHGFPAHCII